jgi:hypothetical protein
MTDDEPEKSQYDYLQENMSIEAWTWEFTRRDPAYQKACAGFSPHSDIEQSGQDIPIITKKEAAFAARFGLLFFR